MAPTEALLTCYSSGSVSRRVLLLLTDTAPFQQVMQPESQSLLHSQAIRKVEDDAEYNSTEPIDASQLKQTTSSG